MKTKRQKSTKQKRMIEIKGLFDVKIHNKIRTQHKISTYYIGKSEKKLECIPKLNNINKGSLKHTFRF